MDKYKTVQFLLDTTYDNFERGRDCDEDCMKCKKIILNENKESNVVGWFPCRSKKIRKLD